jgi:hypothetical protein
MSPSIPSTWKAMGGTRTRTTSTAKDNNDKNGAKTMSREEAKEDEEAYK